jgi:hypothetical protein
MERLCQRNSVRFQNAEATLEVGMHQLAAKTAAPRSPNLNRHHHRGLHGHRHRHQGHEPGTAYLSSGAPGRRKLAFGEPLPASDLQRHGTTPAT